MNKFLLIIILVFLFCIEGYAKENNYYLNYLKNCSSSYVEHYLLKDDYSSDRNRLDIFESTNLNLDCLEKKFEHHKKKYPVESWVGGYIPFDEIIMRKQDTLTLSKGITFDMVEIASLFSQHCGESCKFSNEVILIYEGKYWYIRGSNDLGVESKFINKDIMLVRNLMLTHRQNYIFDINTKLFIKLPNGELEFKKDHILVKGQKSFFEGGGAFWFNSERNYSGEIINLINNGNSCEDLAEFNESIQKVMKTQGLREFCVTTGNTYASRSACKGNYWTNCFGTYNWDDGTKYVGEWKDDKRDGQGTYTYSSGGKYVGEWKDDKRDGQGTYTYPSGDKYVGEWKDHKLNGKVIFFNADGSILRQGIYKDNEFWKCNIGFFKYGEACLKISQNFSGANLKNLNFKGSRMMKASFKGADLSNANFSRAWASMADFSEANMTGINLSRSDLWGASFKDTILINAQIQNVSFYNPSGPKNVFQNADLTGADFTGSNLSGLNLEQTIILDTKFENTNLRGVSFKGKNLSNMNFYRADFGGDGGTNGSNLSNTNFSNADMRRANFSAYLDLFGNGYISQGANLDEANFKNTRLIGANFSGVDLSNANFQNADLRKADFTDAIINDDNFSGANLKEAIFCNTTRLGTSFIFSDYQKVDDTGCQTFTNETKEKYESNFLGWVKEYGKF